VTRLQGETKIRLKIKNRWSSHFTRSSKHKKWRRKKQEENSAASSSEYKSVDDDHKV